MSFTDQKQRVATEEDVKSPWSGVPNGGRFYCYLCGYRFKVNDKWRWVYGGSLALCNLLICEECDGPDVLDKWKKWWEEWGYISKNKFKFIANRMKDAERG